MEFSGWRNLDSLNFFKIVENLSSVPINLTNFDPLRKDIPHLTELTLMNFCRFTKCRIFKFLQILNPIRPGMCVKYFLSFPQKTFQFLNDKIDKNTNFSKLPCTKWLFFGITVIFIIQKLKTKCLVYLSFLW